jgi:hypothetical protein
LAHFDLFVIGGGSGGVAGRPFRRLEPGLAGVAPTERDLSVRRPRTDDGCIRLGGRLESRVDGRPVGFRVARTPANDANPFGSGTDLSDHVSSYRGRRI